MKNVMKRRMNSGRKLGFESLEKREVFTANVTAVLSAGVLTITDADTVPAANTVSVNWSFGGGQNTVTVHGSNGTQVNSSVNDYSTHSTVNKVIYTSSDAYASTLFFESNWITNWSLNHLDITTGSAGDNIYVTDIDLSGYLSIDAKGGDNNIGIYTSSAGQTTTIATGNGNDTIDFDGFNMNSSSQNLTIQCADGNDVLRLFDVDVHTLNYSNINMGNNDDSIEFSGTNFFKDLAVTMYNNTDSVTVNNNGLAAYTLTLTGTTNTFDGGAGSSDLFTPNGEISGSYTTPNFP